MNGTCFYLQLYHNSEDKSCNDSKPHRICGVAFLTCIDNVILQGEEVGILSRLETELNVYKARYGWTNQRICDVLGIKDTAYRSKRRGFAPFTAKELMLLSEMLNIEPKTLYDMLPPINH